MARGAFGRGLVKLKVPDTDVRAGSFLTLGIFSVIIEPLDKDSDG